VVQNGVQAAATLQALRVDAKMQIIIERRTK
jgi:hypothetical protein